jgi:hypothetical protein
MAPLHHKKKTAVLNGTAFSGTSKGHVMVGTFPSAATFRASSGVGNNADQTGVIEQSA